MFIAAGGVFLFSKTVTVLSLKNLDHPSSFYIRINPPERVTLFYINSMFDAPVEEVFEVRKGDIVLRAVETESPAVMEYYGFEDTTPVQSMNRSIGSILSIQTSMGQDQRFRVGERSIDLRAMAYPGDEIQIRVEDVSLASFLLSGVLHH